MKKKLFSIVMTSLFALSAFSICVAHANEATGLSYDAAVAYQSVIDEARATYGDFRGYDTDEYAYTGLGLVRLLDFDGNGTLELVIACGTPDDEEYFFFEVYGYQNGLIKYAHQECCATMDLHCSLYFFRNGNNIYALTGDDSICDATDFYHTIKDGKWVTTEYYMHDSECWDYEYCPLAGKEIYRIDGKTVSAPEWLRQTEQFESFDPEMLLDEGWEYYYFGVYGAEKARATIADVIQKGPELSVTIDGKKVSFDQPPIIVNDRTMVPLRAIFEALGASVEWDGTTRTVTSTKGGTTISMTIGSNTMYKNGTAIILDVAPQLVGDRTLVPARAVAESFNCTVDWNGTTRTVLIATKK